MEEQDAALPFRVRVDVSQRRAGGDAVALGVGVVWIIYLEIRRRRSVQGAYAKPDLGSCVLLVTFFFCE